MANTESRLQEKMRPRIMHFARGGFSLTEVLVALIIIVILISLSVPDFTKPKQAALDKRAKAALLLLQAAEKVYYLKAGFYYPAAGFPSADVSGINSFLRLSISDENWNFGITSGGEDTFTATTQQAGGRNYRITREDEEAQQGP